MKRTLILIMAALLIAGFAFANGQGEARAGAQAGPIILKAGHGAQAAHPTQNGLEKFAELVKERTKGAVEVQVYPNRQLGEERDMVEGLQLGTVDFTVVSTGPLGGFVPEIGVVDLPFLFVSGEHAYKVLDGEIGKSILDKFTPKGILGLAFWENGWRHLSTKNTKVQKPEDLRGLKIRTMENKVHMASFQAAGASPIPMVWGEVYTSLQQGIIDGQENPPVVVYSNALWEVQKYYALTGHFYGPHVFLASKKNMDKLPKEYQKIIMDTAKELSKFQRDLSAQIADQQIKDLRAKGMDVYEVQKQAFQDAMKPVYAQYEGVFGKDLIDRILAAGK